MCLSNSLIKGSLKCSRPYNKSYKCFIVCFIAAVRTASTVTLNDLWSSRITHALHTELHCVDVLPIPVVKLNVSMSYRMSRRPAVNFGSIKK